MDRPLPPPVVPAALPPARDAVTFRYSFEHNAAARVFATRVQMRLEVATLVDDRHVYVVVDRDDIYELDRIAMASKADWKLPGVWT